MEIFLGPAIKNEYTLNRGLYTDVHNKTVLPHENNGIELVQMERVERTFYQRLPEPYNTCFEEGSNYESILYEHFTKLNLTYRQRY